MASILPAISLHTQAAIFICVIVLLVTYHRKKDRHHRLPYPPGPKPLPLLGNLLHIPTTNVAAEYQKLAKEYGGLVFLSVLGKNILLVNSFQHAKTLLGDRNFSDRPTSVMSSELMGWDFSFGHMRYGPRWSKHRTMFQGEFGQSNTHLHRPVQTKAVHVLLRGLLHSPEMLTAHLSLNAAEIIMGVTYGIPINSTEDRYIAIAEKALEGMSEAANPGRFWVDLLPALKYVPEWMPGAGFQRKAREWRSAVTEMRDAPFATVVDAMNRGQANHSFTSKKLSDVESTSKDSDKAAQLETIKNCAGLAYAAGAESIASTLATFVLAMLTHPEVQAEAHKQITMVIPSDRLPELDDRPTLPYIDGILKEVLRWNPVAPLSLPHMATEHADYDGFFIPAGTIIVGNSWGILHDPDIYQNPDRFDPTRHEKGVNAHLATSDPLSVTFGYGRRICPGRFMAETQVWLSIACIIHAFEITPAVDANGSPIEVIPKFSSGMISHPLPFDFCIKPRKGAEKLLLEQTNN